jgi:hypothetical protein
MTEVRDRGLSREVMVLGTVACGYFYPGATATEYYFTNSQ